MQTRQTAVIIGVGVFVVVANIIGQYAVLRHFEARRLAGGDAKPSDVSPPPSLFDLPAPRNLGDLSLTTFPEDVPARSAALANSADESDPAIDPDRHIQNIGGDSPFTLSPELPASPARLTATEDARPIARGIANSVIRAIVEQELPNATDEERDIWAEELQGMPAAAMRNLLRLRRDSGTQLSFNTDVLSKNSRLKQSQKAECPAARTRNGHALSEMLESDLDSEAAKMLQPSIFAIRQAYRVVLNNIANANTVGFKRSRVIFTDLPYQQVQLAGLQDSQGHLSPVGMAVGAGVQLTATPIDHSQGAAFETTGQLDVAILGDGFFQIQGHARTLYTRCGRFTLNAEGNIVLASAASGRLLDPSITIPPNAEALAVLGNGRVFVSLPGHSATQEVGQIQLATFVNPSGLKQLGDNLFAETEASGTATTATPAEDGTGTIKQHFLERSNVSPHTELAELMRLEHQLQAIARAISILSVSDRGNGDE